MHELCREFYSDLGPALNWPFLAWFNFVRQIPYMEDGRLIGDPWHEVLSRPGYILNGTLPFADCKKKAILVGSWCWGNGMPYKFIACCEDGTGEIHHVFPLVWNGSGFTSADCTFPEQIFGEPKPTLSVAKELPP